MARIHILEAPVKPFWHATGATTTTPVAVHIPYEAKQIKVWVDVLSYLHHGMSITATSVGAVDAVQTISSRGTPTGGTWKAQFMGQTTSALAYNVAAATFDTAFELLTTVGSGGVVSAGGALPTSITVTFSSTRFAGREIPLIRIVEQSLTGGTDPAIEVTTSTVGTNPYAYAEAGTETLMTVEEDTSIASGLGFGFLYVATVSGNGNYRISAYK